MKLKSFCVKCANVDQVRAIHNRLTGLGYDIYNSAHGLVGCLRGFEPSIPYLGLDKVGLKIVHTRSLEHFTEELSFEDAMNYLNEVITSQEIKKQGKGTLKESENKPLTLGDIKSMITDNVSSIEIREDSFIVTSEYTDRTYKVSDQEGLIELVQLLNKLSEYDEV